MTATPDLHPDRSFDDRGLPHATPVSAADDARTVLINRISWAALRRRVAGRS